MKEARYPALEEERVGMACESAVGAAMPLSTYDDGGATYADDDIATDEELEQLDWSRFPSFGPFSEEEAIARIDEFEKELAEGKIKWIPSEAAWAQLHERFPWLR